MLPWIGQKPTKIWFKKKCVKKAAIGATSSLYPSEEAESLVEECFTECFNDQEPFM